MKYKAITIINTIFFIITTLAGFLFAGMYLFRPDFMPYHAVAVGMPWADVPAEFQILIIALMRVSGGGWLATSAGMTILLIWPYRFGKFWPNYGIPAIALSALIPTFIATIYVKQNSPANPPWLLAAILIGVMFITIILSVIFRKR
jgi:hypothetical protein